jgi:putative nucleotidyltransferase with HDIG domain
VKSDPALSPELQNIVKRIDDLPAFPAMLTQLTELLQDPRTSADQLGKVLSTDPSMVSRVLKLVNSAFYGFPGRIGTISQAIMVLGFSAIRNLVLTASVLKSFTPPGSAKGFDPELFWRHSLTVAALSRGLAIEKGLPYIEEVFVAGLLHDIGRVVLHQKLPEEWEKVMLHHEKTGCGLRQAEKLVLGVTHADLGAFLAIKWNLPPPLIRVIRQHHDADLGTDPFEEGAGILEVVQLADELSWTVGPGRIPGELPEPVVPEALWKAAGMNPVLLQGEPGRRLHEEIEKALAFLDA